MINVSKTFFIPNPNPGGEVIESLHDIVEVGLRYFFDNIIEGRVIEPHCLQSKRLIVGVWRWLVRVDKQRVMVKGSFWEMGNSGVFEEELP